MAAQRVRQLLWASRELWGSRDVSRPERLRQGIRLSRGACVQLPRVLWTPVWAIGRALIPHAVWGAVVLAALSDCARVLGRHLQRSFCALTLCDGEERLRRLTPDTTATSAEVEMSVL